MSLWTCPACDRSFGKRGQSHTCVPAMTIDEFFDPRPEWQRELYEAIASHVDELGDVYVEAVAVGIFFKHARNFAELRPKRDRRRQERLVLSLMLRREVHHPRMGRTIRWGEWFVHHVDLRAVDEVDEDVRAWLTESYDNCGP